MPLRQFTFRPGQQKEDVRATSTGTVTALAGGATTLGGTVGVRIVFDDAVIQDRATAHAGLKLLRQVMREATWPPS